MNYTVELCPRNEIKDFIEHWHYSHNINGLISDYCFKLLDGKDLIGGIIYGKMAMANQWRKYGDSQEDVIELRRLCCIDDTLKNTESFFIGKTLKWLIANTDIKTVISYADNTYNHSGIIYRASNFKHLGKTTSGKVILYKGKRYHDKTIRTKYNGKLKPFAIQIRAALENGDAQWVKTKPKEIYLYDLETRRKSRSLRVCKKG